MSVSTEGNRSIGSTLRIRDPTNTYKCYESIPTPSPISPNGSGDEYSKNNNSISSSEHSSNNSNKSNNKTRSKTKNKHTAKENKKDSGLNRSASLDSLANSEQDSSEGEENIERISDSDSTPELGEITGSTCAEIHRRSDLEEMKNFEAPNGPVIKAYLEKSHKACDFKNCSFKKSDDQEQEIESQIEYEDDDEEEPIRPINIKSNNPAISTGGSISSISSSVKNRRNSITSSGSVGRMETIIEEPIEAKVSVKEILARFETLREAAEVFKNTILYMFYFCKYVYLACK
jgi:hypothetical protein